MYRRGVRLERSGPVTQVSGDGWTRVADIVGIRRDRVVAQSRIRRPDDKEYHGGHETAEGYASDDSTDA